LGKALCLISENPDIQSIINTMEEKKKSHHQRMSFIEKQIETANKQFESSINEDLINLEKILKNSGKLPNDFYEEKDKYKLKIHFAKNIIEVIDVTQEKKLESILPAPMVAFYKAIRDSMEEN